MPTNLIQRLPKAPDRVAKKPGRGGMIYLEAQGVRLELNLYPNETAVRIARALPLFGVGEPWGRCLHFEVPVLCGRERSARINGRLGEVYYWPGENRILVPYGPTPISRDNEIRLPQPCNPWATVHGNVAGLQTIKPGAKVALRF